LMPGSSCPMKVYRPYRRVDRPWSGSIFSAKPSVSSVAIRGDQVPRSKTREPKIICTPLGLLERSRLTATRRVRTIQTQYQKSTHVFSLLSRAGGHFHQSLTTAWSKYAG
jgi:hypothetical protein